MKSPISEKDKIMRIGENGAGEARSLTSRLGGTIFSCGLNTDLVTGRVCTNALKRPPPLLVTELLEDGFFSAGGGGAPPPCPS